MQFAASSTALRSSQASDDALASLAHVCFCFDVLRAHLMCEEAPVPTFSDALCPLFVTWKKGEAQHLRGCIGTLEPKPLVRALNDYSLTSALRDSRFAPIRLKEVPQLSCGVSLLRLFEAASSHLDWTVGTHGLICEFQDPVRRCKRSATFLPEVAAEQGWSKLQCIDALIRKSGYDGTITDTLRCSLRLTRYQSSKASLTYAEYASLRAAQQLGMDAALLANVDGAVEAASATTVVYA